MAEHSAPAKSLVKSNWPPESPRVGLAQLDFISLRDDFPPETNSLEVS